MVNALLTRIESNNKNLRSSEVKGELLKFPEVGGRITIIAPPLESGDFRQVTTSLIQEVEMIEPNHYKIKTLNSLYALRILGENGDAA